jgi:hypothetical protein
MEEPKFLDYEQKERIREQSKTALNVLMAEMIENPSVNQDGNIRKLLDYLDSLQSE